MPLASPGVGSAQPLAEATPPRAEIGVTWLKTVSRFYMV